MHRRSRVPFSFVCSLALVPLACADRDARDATSVRDPIALAIPSIAPTSSAIEDSGVASATPDAAPDADTDDAARGNMFGDPIGDSFGAGALGLSGMGEGAGGQGEGIGLGNVGGLGHGAGSGSGVGASDGGARPSAVRMREGAVSVTGRLPPEVIRRIVRQNFGRFRLCFMAGLKTKPKLAGTVTTRFTIDAAGAVTNATDAGSALADKAVVSCVVKGFVALSFPQPEGGTVVVSYPITFAPGD